LAAGLAVDQPVRLYCGGGIAASALALGLTLAGFTDIAIYDGSLQEWSAGRCSLYVLLTIFTPPDSQDFALLGSWL